MISRGWNYYKLYSDSRTGCRDNSSEPLPATRESDTGYDENPVMMGRTFASLILIEFFIGFGIYRFLQ